MRPSGSDNRLNSTLANMVATRGSEDINAQLILFYTIYTNNNHKLLAGVRKPAIL